MLVGALVTTWTQDTAAFEAGLSRAAWLVEAGMLAPQSAADAEGMSVDALAAYPVEGETVSAYRAELRKLIDEYSVFLGDADAEPKRLSRRLYGALQMLLAKLTCLLREQEATSDVLPPEQKPVAIRVPINRSQAALGGTMTLGEVLDAAMAAPVDEGDGARADVVVGAGAEFHMPARCGP